MRERYAFCAQIARQVLRLADRSGHARTAWPVVCVALAVVLVPGCGSGVLDETGTLGSAVQVSAPTFVTPIETGLLDTLNVEVACDTSGAVVYYTTDGFRSKRRQ